MKWNVHGARGGVTALLLSLALPAGAATVLYPDAQSPAFSVEVPQDWRVEPAQASGGFVSFTSPTGTRLSLRTLAASREAVEDAMAQAREWMDATYSALRLHPPLQLRAGPFTGHHSEGSGMRRSDARSVMLALDWILFQPDQHVEAWLEIEQQDDGSLEEAASIIASLSAR